MKIRSNITFVLLVVGATVCALGVGLVVDRATSQTKAPPLVAKSSTPSADQTIRALQQTLAHFTDLTAIAPSAQTTGYQQPSDNFEVLLPPANGIAFTDSQNAGEANAYAYLASTRTDIMQTLAREDFASAPIASSGSDATLASTNLYQSSTTVCQISLDTALTILCSPLAVLNASANAAKPLVTIYEQAAPNLGTLAVAAPTITPSKTPGFTTANVDVFNGSGETDVYFYKQAGDWQMIHLDWYNDPHENGDVIPNCQDFESLPAARQAFLGTTCYNSSIKVITVIQ
jgi:hypothetical protein